MSLHDYQKRMVQHVLDHDRCGIFAEMGMGKTLTILEAIASLPKPVLIVGPLRVVQTVWEAEARKFGYDYTFARITGTPNARARAAESKADVYLVNVENLSKLRYAYDPHWKWPSVILDESSLFKTAGSIRTRAALWISRRASNIVLLSGTPAPNGLEDLYSQIKLLDGGERLGRNKAQFLNKHFYPENAYYEHSKWIVKPGHDDIIRELISDICVSLQSRDYLELPDRIVNDIHVDMPLPVQRDYDELVEKMYLQLKDTEIDAVSAGVLVGKLAQFASGSVYTDEGLAVVHEEKMLAVKDILEESAGQQVLLVYNYRHTLQRLQAWFNVVEPREGDDVIDRWNAGEVSVMALHPASGGHGLNLQESGAHILVWVDLPYNLEHYEQTNARLHRQGQTHPVMIHRIMAVGTIDDVIAEALANKSTVQDTLMRSLR